MNVGVIDARWIGWFPRAGWNIAFWLRVARERRRRGISRGDRDAIVALCTELYANRSNAHGKD